MGWKDLDIKQKAELIKLGVQSGIRDKNKIIQMYDQSVEQPTQVKKFEDGGLINTEQGQEQQVGLERLIQDYQILDPTALFGVKTQEDSYKVSEAIRKYQLAKLAVEKEKEDIIKNDVEKFINKDTFASPKPAVVTIMKSGTLAGQNSNEVQELLETTQQLLQEEDENENSNKEENKQNTDVSTEEGLLFNWNKDSYPKKNSWEQVTEIAKPNIEEYQKSVQEKLKKQKELEEQQRKIQEQIRLDSIQKNVQDSLTKEQKPNTVEAQSIPVEVDKNTIQEIQDIITPKLEKGTSEYYADSTAKHINRVLDEHFLQNPTQYSLQTDNFNFNKIQESFIHKDVNKESHRQPTDNSYIKGRQPLEHQHRAIIIHSSAGTPNGDLKSLTGKERSRDPKTGELLYNEDRTPKFRQAGAHFYISQNGKIYQLVGEDKVAFHSSVGQMFDAVDPNSFAFGIELEGYSYEEGKYNEHKNTDFSKNPKQLESLGKVIAYLCNKYNIPYELIQTHYDVDDYYEQNFYKNLGFQKGIEGRKDQHGIEWKPPRGKVDIMPKQYAPIKNYLETYVFKKINNEHAYGGYINNQQPVQFRQFNKGGYISNNPTQTYSGGGPIKRKRENSLDWRMAVYNAVDPRTTVKNIDDAFRLYNAAVAKEKRGEDFKDYTLNNNIGDLTSDAAWRKRLELPYDETLLPVWNGDTVSLSRPLELEIPVDTNLVKDRINYAKDEFWNDVKSLNLRQLKEDLAYKKSQEELLDALRYTYKTGKPIGISEYHANSIDPEKVLKDFKYGISPLNVLGRYNIRYDKDENKMYYSDEWDFNQYEWAVPGTTFRIRGAIPLEQKKNGGFIFPNQAFSHKFEK